MPPRLEFITRSTIFDRERKLMIDPGYVEFDDKDLADSTPTKFLKEEIEGIRYGVKGIRMRIFNIGRIYCIDIRNNKGHIIKLRLQSLYGVRRKLLTEKYVKICNSLLSYIVLRNRSW